VTYNCADGQGRSFGSSNRAWPDWSTANISSTCWPKTSVFDFIITVPDYPRHVVGRADLIELFRGYGAMFFLHRCYNLRVHHSPSTSTVVLEYSSEGKVVATGWPYGNRYISVVVIQGPQGGRLARLPGPVTGLHAP